ncbi:hypothetical protein [Colwellia hornerae]|uniref:Uncharacterized protein n=1 Tax=Colwellia hornerae TaxID=89402 RepID=A0A5C6Q872_9GAMM|nr:hypothetical protein [Colwellia hornerae]TWX57789.1 hypothetical protein ESZ28_03520 [Colwellia hornerae]TWX62480.1 hypothetical protein ESZ26_01165 [Colwellia hornerae]TWX65039.1 hypothetical protein ESZ27_13030 [Colwellia hornerae]
MIGVILVSIVLFFVINKFAVEKTTFKDVLFFLAIPFLALFTTRLLLWITEADAIVNLAILLSLILVTIFYVFMRSKSKFELSNKHAVIVSFVYFFSLWASEFLSGLAQVLMFT